MRGRRHTNRSAKALLSNSSCASELLNTEGTAGLWEIHSNHREHIGAAVEANFHLAAYGSPSRMETAKSKAIGNRSKPKLQKLGKLCTKCLEGQRQMREVGNSLRCLSNMVLGGGASERRSNTATNGDKTTSVPHLDNQVIISATRNPLLF